MHHLMGWTGNNSGPANNFDLPAITDTIFSVRSNHFWFSAPLNIAYLWAQSTNMTDARIFSPTFAAINADGFRITGFQKATGVGGVPTLFDRFISSPIPLPQQEEIQASGSTGTGQQQWVFMSVITPNGIIPVPAGPLIVMEGTFGAFTPAANVWSGGQNVTLTSNPRGGVYALVRATVQQVADTLAFRIIFNRVPSYKGYNMRPGWCVQNAVGAFDDVITQINPFHLGVWGYFHSAEMPLIEVVATTSAAITPIFRFWCVYLGGDMNLLSQLVTAATII